MDFEQRLSQVKAQLDAVQPEQITPYGSYEVPAACTLIAYPPQAIAEQVAGVSRQLQDIEPDHYYYPPAQYHVTLQGFGPIEPTAIDLTHLRTLIPPGGIKVRAYGIVSNVHTIGIPVYPMDNTFNTLRAGLRELVGEGEEYTAHGSYWEEMLWINFIRYQHQPDQTFIAALQEWQDTDFGMYVIDNPQLYQTSSRVLAPESSRLLYKV